MTAHAERGTMAALGTLSTSSVF